VAAATAIGIRTEIDLSRNGASGAIRPELRTGTQELALDAAERLFAAQGYEGTSIRQIADATGINLGMFHYYWRSKQVLCRAVLERRLGPIMAERRAMFERALATGASLEDLLRAAVEPSLIVVGASAHERETFRNFYGRMLVDPSEEVRSIVTSIFDDFARSFMEQLHLQCTHIDDKEFYWRMVFLYGAFLYAHNDHNRIHALLGARFNPPPIEDSVRYLVRFLAAGLQSASADPPKRARSATNRKKT
jgi:AcrR family transcriptional regulator